MPSERCLGPCLAPLLAGAGSLTGKTRGSLLAKALELRLRLLLLLLGRLLGRRRGTRAVAAARWGARRTPRQQGVSTTDGSRAARRSRRAGLLAPPLHTQQHSACRGGTQHAQQLRACLGCMPCEHGDLRTWGGTSRRAAGPQPPAASPAGRDSERYTSGTSPPPALPCLQTGPGLRCRVHQAGGRDHAPCAAHQSHACGLAQRVRPRCGAAAGRLGPCTRRGTRLSRSRR